jgi:predicted acylesterase/phospholipase RssA
VIALKTERIMTIAGLSRTRISFSPNASKLKDAKSIGVALGPGIPEGVVSVGMLLALGQLNTSVSMISGTSMGSVVGALYAAGMTAAEIRDRAFEIFADNGVMRLIREDMKLGGFGFSSGELLIKTLKKILGWDPDFYELKVPLFILASDREAQRSIILRHGKVFDAVRASMAMPLLMEEKKLGGMQLADGAIFYPLDTKVLYHEGADFVMAMHAKPIKSERKRELPLKSKLEPKLLKKLGWKTDPEVFFSKPSCDLLLRPRVTRDLSRKLAIDEIVKLGTKITYDAFHLIDQGKLEEPTLTVPETESVEKINAEITEKTGDIAEQLQALEKAAEGMTDAQLLDEFPKFPRLFDAFLTDLSSKYPEPEMASSKLKELLKDFTNLVDHSPFLSRCFHKPRGYAGDYQMMNYLYDDEVFGQKSHMGKLLDYYMFSSPAANAVKNRAKVIQGLIQHRVAGQAQLHIASIASGPAREVASTISMLSEYAKNCRIYWTLLDQDKEAMQNARENMPQSKLVEPRYINAGVREMFKRKVDLGKQDIIYSLGLFDYLEDKIAISLIGLLYSDLKPGGLLLVGNFHISNPLRAFMEGLSDWYLIHRTEEAFLQLGKEAVPEARHFVMAEPEGVNLILVTSKPLQTES